MRARTAVLGRGEVAPGAPVAAADDAGAARGDGVFETLLVLGGPPVRPVHLDAHLERLARSAHALDLPAPDLAAWRELAVALSADVPAGAEAVLRLTLTRGVPGAGPTGLAALRPVPPALVSARERGVRVVALTRGTPARVHAAAPWLLGGAKVLSYAVHAAALREAARRGADDALLTSTEGLVLEGATSSAVWAAGGRLLTAPVDGTGVLPGTTQRAVFAGAAAAGIATGTDLVPVARLRAADAVWLTSSVRGVVEVTHLDGEPLARRTDLTARLRAWALA
ncbi:aminotransferase class IV [Kineococcus sp. TRM81007]|uniref:aminotransferase class IV n=1 Tax=Kineococcus sp. TRM81007 TaxID=2925831 RepID=UPI001F57D712|nr:aminotransferase class IV [Kineococcus sp. TRM81007]MCI2240108.1 aminotransferase class IV [Kineococcus sp. TRM81007]